MTDKSLTTIVGEDQDPIQDLTDYVDWDRSRFMSMAYNGESSVSSIVFRDDDSEMGPWIDTPITIAARNEVEVKLGSTFIWRGRLIGRTWERGIQKANEARVVTAEAEDVNVELRGIIVDQWERPDETDVARVQALGADYLDGSVRVGTVIDVTTYVPDTNTVLLPAKTYTQTDPYGVLRDIAFLSDKMFFVTLDKELFYDEYTSSAYATTLFISEDYGELQADADNGLAIVPDVGPLFAINGQRFVSAIRLYYGSGSTDFVDGSDPGLEAVKAHWGEVVYAPDTVTNATEAGLLLNQLLTERSQDGRTFSLSVRNADGEPLTEAQVGELKPGKLITIKSHVLPLASYSEYAARIVSVQWHMPLPNHYYATLKLERPEKLYGVGAKPGPRPPASTTTASCALGDEDMTEIAVENGGAEDGVNTNTHYWGPQPFSFETLASSGTAPHSGAYFVRWQSVGDIHYEFKGITFQAGVTYALKLWMQSISGQYLISFGQDPAGDATELFPVPGQGQAWARYCIEWTPSATYTSGIHLGVGGTGGAVTVDWDDIQLFMGHPGDVPADVGDTADPGTDTGVYAPIGHVHAHGQLSAPSDAHDAVDVSVVPFTTIAATNVQAALEEIVAEAGGVTDHGALTGLTDDDHTQYIKDSEFTASGDLLRGTGAGTFAALKNNLAASTAPTVNDDSGDGYAVGSSWLDTTNDKEYVALDVTVAAAVWKERTNIAGGGATIIVREVAGADIEDVAELEFDASDFVVTEPSAGVARVELTSPGGSGGWDNPISESGASFASFTSESGTWASDGTLIQQTGTGATHKRAHHNTLVPIGAGLVIEVDVRVVTTGSGVGADIAAGILIGHPGSNTNGAIAVVFEPNSDTIQVENSGIAVINTMALTLALDTWYTLRTVSSGGWISVYVDGTLLGSSFCVTASVPHANSDFVGLVAYDAVADFRNFDVWHPTLP